VKTWVAQDLADTVASEAAARSAKVSLAGRGSAGHAPTQLPPPSPSRPHPLPTRQMRKPGRNPRNDENEAKAGELKPLVVGYREETAAWKAVEAKYADLMKPASAGGGGDGFADEDDVDGDPLSSAEGAAIAAKYASAGALADLTRDKLADVFFGVRAPVATWQGGRRGGGRWRPCMTLLTFL